MPRLALTLLSWLAITIVVAQCPPGPLGTGNFLDKPAGCATNGLDIMFTPLYSQLDDNATIVIDWGDGTANTMIPVGANGNLGISYNTPEPHTYTEANTAAGCVYEITAYVMSGCYTQEETTVTAEIVIWNTDNFGDGGADLTPAPLLFEVCAGTTATVQFEDLSPWNCTDLAVTTSVNNLPRWTQWQYGVIDNITGNVSVDGNVETYPFDGAVEDHDTAPVLNPEAPGNLSLQVDIPITAQVGEEFHVRLNNWNQCNPYEDGLGVLTGNDPVFVDAIVRVVAPPVPDFEDLDAPGGTTLTEYCIGDGIFFNNLSTNVNVNTIFTWEFYDVSPPAGTPIETITAENATYAFTSGGVKGIRLIATNPDLDAACDVVFDGSVTVTPDVVADIVIYDELFTAPINPLFCQTGEAPALDEFSIGIADESTNTDPATEYRYEIRDGAGTLLESIPATGFATVPIADFTRTYSEEGIYEITLFARNPGSACSSSDTEQVIIYGQPTPTFTANEVCEGSRTTFSDIVDPTTGFTVRVDDDIIDTYEWDFSYDGVTFNSELTRTDATDFDRFIDGSDGAEPAVSAPGTYTIALRATTQKGSCSEIFTGQVTVNENPNADLATDITGEVCPNDPVTFTNTSTNPGFVVTYTLTINHTPSGFNQVIDFNSADTTLTFPNTDDIARTYEVTLLARTEDGCETVSALVTFDISPDENSGFSDLNYDFFSSNCSPWSSTLSVDQDTRDLSPESYQWTLSDENGVLDGFPVAKVSGDPDFHILDYQVDNTTNAIRSVVAVLEVTKAGVCVSNDTLSLQISPQPSSEFAMIRSEDCDAVVLELEATQKGLTAYNWSFDPVPTDEFGENDQRLISYNRAANTATDFDAEITLQTENLAGCISEQTIQMETVERRKPDITADFVLSSDTIQLPDAILSLTNTSTDDPSYSYLWEFGDDATSTDREPTPHSYDRFGSFLVRLTITDEFCEVQSSQSVVVLPADPVIDFEADTLQGCTPLTIQFTNLSQNAEPGEFLWEFGDGSISELDNPIHTYFEDGVYDVRLRGTNDVGVVMETEKDAYITAYGRPFADFLVSARVVFIPDQQAFFRNLSDNAVEYFWDFGDGTTSEETDPAHAYMDEGFYDIQLIAVNELGCADTLFRAAEIEAIIGGEANSPNAFTPNLSGPNGGVPDGGLNVNSVNDIFLPKAEGVVRYRMYIYNKWGQLLFQSEDQNVGWDGYFNGRLAPAGVYVYKLELRYSDGRDEIIAGDVTLLR